MQVLLSLLQTWPRACGTSTLPTEHLRILEEITFDQRLEVGEKDKGL